MKIYAQLFEANTACTVSGQDTSENNKSYISNVIRTGSILITVEAMH